MKLYEKDYQYVKSIFDDVENIENPIIKVHVDIGLRSYTKKIGDPMKENTLIVGDKENNIYMIFDQQEGICKPVKNIMCGVDLINHLKYDKSYIVYKKQNPKKIPCYIINLINQNITNNFQLLNIGAPTSITVNNSTGTTYSQTQCSSSVFTSGAVFTSEAVKQKSGEVFTNGAVKQKSSAVVPCADNYTIEKNVIQCKGSPPSAINVDNEEKVRNFMHTYYEKEKIVPLTKIRKCPIWKKEYEDCKAVQSVNICKSCKNKAFSNKITKEKCCQFYAANNRIKIKMVVYLEKAL